VNEFVTAGAILHAEYDSTDCVQYPGGVRSQQVFPGTGTSWLSPCDSSRQQTYRPYQGMLYFADYTDAQLDCLDPATP
jgi:hypothetical protein